MPLSVVDQQRRGEADQRHRGGRVPEGVATAAAHAKRVLQEPEDRRNVGPEQLVYAGRAARRRPGNGEDTEGKDILHIEKRRAFARPLSRPKRERRTSFFTIFLHHFFNSVTFHFDASRPSMVFSDRPKKDSRRPLLPPIR